MCHGDTLSGESIALRTSPAGLYDDGVATERREQVFVSSTYVDLVEERQEVIQTLLEADCIPAGMELFPASDDDRWTLIKRVIDDSDYYVVVVGGRYGTVDPEEGISYTEKEFDYAAETNTPIMGFLHGEPGAIPADRTELGEEARQRLEAFREKVGGRMVKFWTSPQELGGQVAKSLIQIRKTHPAEGWVRARDAITPEVESELADLRVKVANLTTELDRARSGPVIPDLARGDDEYGFVVHESFYTQQQHDEGRTKAPWARPGAYWAPTASVSWNDLFAALGPFMMDECSEADLSEHLDSVAESLMEPLAARRPSVFGSSASVEAGPDVLNDLKVQLFSLGLIERSERRRAVSDQNTYWTLTDAGRDQLMRLRAIRRPPAADSEADAEETQAD